MQYKNIFSGLLALSFLGMSSIVVLPQVQAAETEETQSEEPQAAADDTQESQDAPSNPAVVDAVEPAKTEAVIPNNTAPEQPAPKVAEGDKPIIQSKSSVEWIPLARINPEKNVTIELNNTTGEPLEYLITTHTNFRTLAPGQKATLIVTDFPSFVNINAKRTVGVKYLLQVKDNMIKVDLKLAPGQGDTTLNIHEKGAIYLY